MLARPRALGQLAFEFLQGFTKSRFRLRPVGVHDVIGTFILSDGSDRKKRRAGVRRVKFHIEAQQLHARVGMT